MKIRDLLANQGFDSLSATVKDISSIKEFSKFGRIGKVASALISDDTGEIRLMLWDEQIYEVRVGEKITIIGGYIKEWKGEKQVNIGRNGMIEINRNS